MSDFEGKSSRATRGRRESRAKNERSKRAETAEIAIQNADSIEPLSFAAADLNTIARYGIGVGEPYVENGIYKVALTQNGVTEVYTEAEVRKMAHDVAKELKKEKVLATQHDALAEEITALDAHIARAQSEEQMPPDRIEDRDLDVISELNKIGTNIEVHPDRTGVYVTITEKDGTEKRILFTKQEAYMAVNEILNREVHAREAGTPSRSKKDEVLDPVPGMVPAPKFDVRDAEDATFVSSRVEASEDTTTSSTLPPNIDPETVPVLMDTVPDSEMGGATVPDALPMPGFEKTYSGTPEPSLPEMSTGALVPEDSEKREPSFKDTIPVARTEEPASSVHKKPHLDNAASRAYLREVQQMRERSPKDAMPENSARESVLPTEPEQFFDSRYKTELGIDRTSLETIEGFDRLSIPQRKLIFENLQEYRDQQTTTLGGRVWSRVGQLLGVPPTEKEHRVRGIDAYRTILTKLVYAAEHVGPKIYEEDGVLMPDFVGMRYDRARRKEQKEAADALNQAAHRLARIPASWQENIAGEHTKQESSVVSFFKERFSERRKEYRAYEAHAETFRMAKEAFVATLRETGVPSGDIARKLIAIDGQVHMLRTIDTNPETCAALGSIEEPRAIERVANWVTEKSVYFTFGTVSRAAAAGMLGWLSGPVVAASLGGVRSWNKIAAEQRERDRQARMGVQDMGAGALNIVNASQTITVEGKQRKVGLTQKLADLVLAYHALPPLKDIEGNVELEKKRNEILDKLNVRTAYCHDKFRLNRIQFGGKNDFVVNQIEFLEVLGEARAILEDHHAPPETKLEYRLERYMKHREASIGKKRVRMQAKQAAKAALTAAGFSLAGVALVEELKTEGVSTKLKEWFPSYPTFDNSGEVPSLPPDNTSSAPESPKSRAALVGPDTSAEVQNEKIYTIKKGDTLTGILKSEVPEVAVLGESRASTVAVENIIRSLSSDELKSIGIDSGNADRIRSGDTIDMEKLRELIETRTPMIESAEARFAGVAESSSTEAVQETDALNREPIRERIEPLTADPDRMSALTEKKANILESYFLKKHIEPKVWSGVRAMNAEVFIANALEAGTQASQPPVLTQLGKAFDAVKAPPFALIPAQGETTESFMRRMFRELASREGSGAYPENVRKVLKMIDLKE